MPIAMLIAAASLGCAGPLPLPTSGPPTHQAESPSPSSDAETPLPSPTAPIATGAPEPSQGAIFHAVGSWLVKNRATELTSTTYLLIKLGSEGWYLPTEVPELAGAVVPPWGDRLTEPSQVALTETLSPIADLQTVDDQGSVIDEAAYGPLNCHPYMEGRTMLRLERPMVIGSAYFVEVNVDLGCQGSALLLRVEVEGTQIEVTQVVRDGHWIV